MKTCSTCRKPRPLNAFALNRAKSDGRQTVCRRCKKKQDKAYYTSGRKEQVERNRKYRAEIRRKLFEYLRTHGCVDCPEKDPVVLEFDHVRGKKLFNITAAVNRGISWEKILKEIAKCDVRCANCHRRRTVRQCRGLRLVS